jgi:hypothetical protein
VIHLRPRPNRMSSMENYNLVIITCLNYNPIIINLWICNLLIELQLNLNSIAIFNNYNLGCVFLTLLIYIDSFLFHLFLFYSTLFVMLYVFSFFN